MQLSVSKGISSLIGGFLIQLTLGTFYTIGNMTIYIFSYLRRYSQPEISSKQSIWITNFVFTGMGMNKSIQIFRLRSIQIVNFNFICLDQATIYIQSIILA